MRALLVLLAVAATAWAGEPQPDPATLHLPADALVVVRFASPRRINEIGKDLQALLPIQRRHRPLGEELLREIHGAHRMPIDRSRPFYFAAYRGGTQWLFHAEKNAALPAASVPARITGGMLHLGDLREQIVTRVTPLPIVEGDVAASFPVRNLVDEHRAALDEAVGKVSQLEALARGQGVAVPPALLKLVETIAADALEGVKGVEDIHYALTWRDRRVESEGWVRSREGSKLRGWLNGLTPRAPSDLMGRLPNDALWMVESSGLASAMDAAVASVFDRAYGEGAGAAMLWLFSPSSALHEHLTGRAAGTVHLFGMGAASIQAIHEVKRGAKLEEAIAAIDVEKINARLRALEIPVEIVLEREVGEFRESTTLHRLSYRSTDPRLAMLTAQMLLYFAVQDRYLVVAQSPGSGSVVMGLLGHLRDNQPAPHPHTEAMARLMPDRHEGMTINVGAIKPIVALFGMFSPELAKAIQGMPDELYFSTALAVRDGHIHIRGDWPLMELAKFIADL